MPSRDFLGGYTLAWLETLDKRKDLFSWDNFEKVFCAKFIPTEHYQTTMTKYVSLKQGNMTVGEYIVEQESLENTLGDKISQPLKEASFRSGLEEYVRKQMPPFRQLLFDEYKKQAESIDKDIKERKEGPYAHTKMATSDKTFDLVSPQVADRIPVCATNAARKATRSQRFAELCS
jgi:Retrotransposon gag protein